MNEPQLSLVERNKQATRSGILIAFAALIERDGVGGTNLADVAKLAGVSPSTLFNYFRSKDHLIDALSEAATDRTLLAAVRSRPASERPIAAFRAACREAVTFMAEESFGERQRLYRMAARDDALWGGLLRAGERVAEDLAGVYAERAPGWSRMRCLVAARAGLGLLRSAFDALPEDTSVEAWGQAIDDELSALERTWR